jgi:hypothetical protein
MSYKSIILRSAVLAGYLDIAALALEKGASPGYKDDRADDHYAKDTVMTIAYHHKNDEALVRLLAKHASKKVLNAEVASTMKLFQDEDEDYEEEDFDNFRRYLAILKEYGAEVPDDLPVTAKRARIDADADADA